MRKRKFGPFHIRSLIVTFFAIFMIIVFVVMSFVIYSFTYGSMQLRALNNNRAILNIVANSVERYLNMTEDLFFVIKENDSLMQYLRGNYAYDFEGAQLRDQFSRSISSIPDLRNDIVSIFVFDRNNKPVYVPDGVTMKSYADITKTQWYTAAHAAKGRSVITTAQVRTFTEEPNPWVIPLSAAIQDYDGNAIGTILLELNYKVIDNIFSVANLDNSSYFFMIDQGKNIVYHPQLQLIYTGLKNEQIEVVANAEEDTVTVSAENKMFLISRLSDSGFIVVHALYLDDIISGQAELPLLYAVLILLVALLSVVGSMQLSRYITRPLQEIDDGIRQIESGNMDIRFRGRGTIETEHLSHSLDSMLDRINELMAQTVAGQRQLRQSELRALQSQINPHFLSNTLESIIWIADSEGNQRISNIAMALANYFRLALAGGKDVITIEHEMEHVRNYLLIQKIRYDDYLDFSIHVDEDIKHCMTIKLIVQPIVENAIYHGIKDMGRHGCIDISAKGIDDTIVIEVCDNGMGIPPGKLKHIFDPEKMPRRRIRQGGVGLVNIRDRIQLFYGEQYGLVIESLFRHGTTVRITIPKIIMEEKNNE